MKRILLTLTLCMFMSIAFAQHKVSGVILDSKDGQPLPGATIIITPVGSTKSEGQSSDIDGKFTIKAATGNYVFRVDYLGYASYEKTIEVSKDVNMGNIRMKSESKQLDEVDVKGIMQRQEQHGDTTVFNAQAFKVNPDATTEDLIKKMPGMSVEGGSVKSGGQTVKKVLVDGKEFFGDNPMMALQNISADMVNQIEVFDRQSDQAQFTGFSDGDEERTINILTKMGIKSGAFGRVYAGYGTNDRYEAGGNYNVFNGNHRVTILGLLNNINQQNYSMDDLSSAMSNGGGGGRGGMGGGMMMGGGGMMMGGGGMGAGGWGGQGGKNRTGRFGINYSYDDETTWRIEPSYQYSNTKNINESQTLQEYFENERTYESESYSEARNQNHNLSLRLTYTINENNSLIFNPRVSWSDADNESESGGIDMMGETLFMQTNQQNESDNKSLSVSGNLLWRHKFSVDHRTLSLRLGGSISDTDGDQSSAASNEYTARSIKTKQNTDNDSKNNRLNASLQYTEPIGEKMAFQINYSPSITFSDGDKSVVADTANASGEFSGNYKFSPILSNKKSSTYTQQRAGIGLNLFPSNSFNATFGLDFQQSVLDGDQTYPYEFETSKSYTNFMPSAQIRYNKNRTTNFRLNYRTNTSAPSITQLQKVVDVSNIRSYSGGNEDLNQQYSHNFNLFFTTMNPMTSKGLFFMGMYSTTTDYISTASYIFDDDRYINRNGDIILARESSDDILLPKGVQYSKPVNLNGYYNANVRITLSSPVTFIRSNVNFDLGASLSSRPSLYNDQKVTNDDYSFSTGLTIGSNISENLDFTISYRGNYNVVESSAASNSADYNYYNHTIQGNLNCIFWQHLVFTTSVANQLTSGMGKDYDQNFILWNASLGYKFLKDRRAELRLRVNDILDKNNSVSRSQNETYVSTTTTDVLRQYLMLTFTYKFRNIGDAPTNTFPGFMGGAPPAGGNRGGGRPPMGPMF
ncbi:MAG: TonB-dependent receptor [Bacteroidales bacterium]|nr:TonB-dependent receptor [Bacteroidales bacterium]